MLRSMKKNLILFTVSYPYGNKEQFLETEILYLSKYFKKVTVIPVFIGGHKREVPENIIVDTGFAYRNSNIKFAFSSLVTIYTYNEILSNLSIIFSIKKLQRLISFTGRGVALFKYLKSNYSVENIFYSYWFNGAVFASFLYDQKITKIDYVTRVHGSDLYLDQNNGYLPLRPTVLENIKKIFPISQDGYNYLMQHYRLSKQQISLSRLGTSDRGITTQMSYDPKSFYIVSCSHISQVKRLDLIIKSLASVAQKNPTITFYWTHIGTGEKYHKIKDLAEKMLPKNVATKFLGNLNNKDVFNFYKNHFVDIFINTSISEGIPVTFMEAMSCSIPVLALDVGGVSEIVNNDNGILLDKKASYDTIAEALHRVVNDKSLLAVKKNHARECWNQNYNAEHNYRVFAETLSVL
ncbi:glycosyltransferase [Sulfurovum sp. XGS-02]|uniref:glycosyltransferase n=1 Tax=Sulfurovum sp. XGS-02 TaxID=2925411 RepID=UPI002044F4D2|nr:glycosyltransferase [Sulfurovum sp. XGS-02]UPT77642.1 glycosyltransferase [Sulfurovum sp. XGS-02]